MTDENERHFVEKTLKIQGLNDRFRRTFNGGKILMASGVSELSLPQQITLMTLVRTFDDFSEDNDPYGEHDFGKIELNGTAYFWKIDYYDMDFESVKYSIRSGKPSKGKQFIYAGGQADECRSYLN